VKQQPPKNTAASVRDRLYNLAQRERRDFNLVLTAFATERLLYRLTQSEYADRFVLKGARLFALWSDRPHRPTRDLDLLGFGDPSFEALQRTFQDLCRIEVAPDGLEFDGGSVTVEAIRPDQEYEGLRIKLITRLAQARIPLQVDVGFGDAVTPDAALVDYTSLLETLPAPRIRAYPRETVIAEKLQAMVSLDTLNSRMKDFYDLWVLSNGFDYEGRTLSEAIRATFQRRRTPIPSQIPNCLLQPFAEDPERQGLWKAFLKRSAIRDPGADDFTAILTRLRDFLALPLLAAGPNGPAFSLKWQPTKGWSPEERPIRAG